MVEADGERHSPPSLGQSSAMADLFICVLCLLYSFAAVARAVVRHGRSLCVGSLCLFVRVRREKRRVRVGQFSKDIALQNHYYF